MKRKKLYIGKYIPMILLLISALTLGSIWLFTREKRDEAKLLDTLETLAEDLSKNPNESAAAALIKVKSAASAFAYPADIAMGKYVAGSYDEEKMLASIGRYRSFIKTAKISVNDPEIITIQENYAQIIFSGKFSGTTKNSLSETVINDVTVDFIRLNGQWKIKSARFSQVLH